MNYYLAPRMVDVFGARDLSNVVPLIRVLGERRAFAVVSTRVTYSWLKVDLLIVCYSSGLQFLSALARP
jgi:hypothetical protein